LEGPPVAAPRRPEPAADAGPARPDGGAPLAAGPDAGQAPQATADGAAPAAAPDAGQAAEPADARPAGGSPLCLQVASFRELAQAEALVTRLRAAGYPEVRVGSAETGAKGTYYRVRAGRFTERVVAEQVRARLEREERLKAMVLTCAD
ncbi:MAG TPA: SPOR domain-containing protein, partial [Myxococcota bacterium]|nr:SPOR domain-containing protein [Myxococcota bacterium]